jgi:hypothetical protein
LENLIMSVLAANANWLVRSLTPVASPSEVVRQRVRQKEEIVQQVCRGQLPLLAAAARFRSVSQATGSGSGAQDGEAVCRTVIAWVGLALADRPERAAALTERLEAELESNLARSGRVQLPDLE